MHKKAITLIAALMSFSAQAEWSYVGESDKFTLYIDFSTLRKTPNGYRAWSLHNYEPPVKDGVLSIKSFNDYDCADERHRVLQDTYYSGPMGAGEVLRALNTPDGWTYVSPGSVRELLLEAVCGRRK